MRKKGLKKFWSHIGGNFAVSAAILAAPLFGATALAVDYANIHSKKNELQQLADAAALAATRELSLSKLTDEKVQAIAESFVSANFSPDATGVIAVTAVPGGDDKGVSVDLSYTWQPFFAHYLDKTALPIVAKAAASFAGDRSSICVLALDPSADNAIDMSMEASVTANGCAVFSNSKSSKGLSVRNLATMTGDGIFSSGGYQGSGSNYSPTPITDAPVVPDPLALRPAPSHTGCDKVNFTTEVSMTLTPGVYCGGLDIGNVAVVTLDPGIYILKDGPLTIRGDATVIGEGVGFYFEGDTSVFDFGVSTQVSLSAPKSGPMSGLLFFEDRNAPDLRTFTIRSKDAQKFEGVVYLPKGRLWIDKASKVGNLSDWTAIIAKQVSIGKGPALVINSDYANSDVPVPPGIAEAKNVRLTN